MVSSPGGSGACVRDRPFDFLGGGGGGGGWVFI